MLLARPTPILDPAFPIRRAARTIAIMDTHQPEQLPAGVQQEIEEILRAS